VWLALLAAPAWAAGPKDQVTVALEDGSTLVGTMVQEDEATITVRIAGGQEVRVPRSAVVSIRGEGAAEGAFPPDPSGSRLLFAPTGRPLGKGEGYFSDHYVLFPGVTGGITDNLSLGAGVSVVPGLGLTEQVFYAAPRLAWTLSDKAAVSTGVLYARAWGYQAAVAFGIGTFGGDDASLTVGAGLLAAKDDGDDGEFDVETGTWRPRPARWELRRSPMLMIGGSKRLSRSVAFISENWLFTGKGFDLAEQPFGVGLRFIGDRLSADVGLIFTGEVLEQGLPAPWLSFTYHFPRPRRQPR
jgi:hypothetical protein